MLLGKASISCGVTGAAFAAAPWCPDLARVADLAATNKLAYIAGAPREGGFRDAGNATFIWLGWAWLQRSGYEIKVLERERLAA